MSGRAESGGGLPAAHGPHPLRVAAAFGAVYLIWGSTYLAIRVAVEEFAPFVMAAIRFLAAGALLYAFLRLRGVPRPTLRQWKHASLVGFLLLSCSNAAVTWAERSVPSGLTAVLCAILPVWMVLLEWLRDRTQRPSLAVLLGVLLGILGVVVLIGPGLATTGEKVDLFGAGLIVAGCLTWALGSILSRGAKAGESAPKSSPMATAMQMLSGGAILALAAALNGDWGEFDPAAISPKAWLTLAYLGVFGSVIALSAYVWLLQVSTPARVSTYAYVNPVVAVLLGWAILGEELSARTLGATAIIVTAVVVITTQRSRASAEKSPTAVPSSDKRELAPTPIKR
jgi:drug/metabolite transporter (DMT)-like permease